MSNFIDHVKRNKDIYIGVVICVGATALAITTYVIMKRDFSGKVHLNEHTEFHFSNHGDVYNNSVVSVFERGGRGHPGYLTRHLETGLVYDSQKAAADALGLNYQHMTDHLNGRKNDVLGNHFERIIMAPVEDLAA